MGLVGFKVEYEIVDKKPNWIMLWTEDELQGTHIAPFRCVYSFDAHS